MKYYLIERRCTNLTLVRAFSFKFPVTGDSDSSFGRENVAMQYALLHCQCSISSSLRWWQSLDGLDSWLAMASSHVLSGRTRSFFLSLISFLPPSCIANAWLTLNSFMPLLSTATSTRLTYLVSSFSLDDKSQWISTRPRTFRSIIFSFSSRYRARAW